MTASVQKDLGGLELQLLKTFARHSIDDGDEALAREIVNRTPVNWDLFLSRCIKQKVAGLAYLNLNRWGLEAIVTPAARMAFRLLYHAHRDRNQRLLATMRDVVAHLVAAGIDVRPLKGSVLVPLVYNDLGSRVLSDIDLFIRRDDAPRVREAMTEIGFRQGTYCPATKTIEPLKREDQLIWKLKMFNLPGFMRISEDDFVGVECIDFTFGLSFGEDRDVSNEVMARSGSLAGIETLDPVDFFLHVCCHLYKEASNDAWVQLGLDVNLIKFNDVRELALKLFTPEEQGAANRAHLVDRMAALDAYKSVYFSIVFAHQIYGDRALSDLLAILGDPPEGQTDFMSDIYLQGEKKIGTRGQMVLDAIVSLAGE